MVVYYRNAYTAYMYDWGTQIHEVVCLYFTSTCIYKMPKVGGGGGG